MQFFSKWQDLKFLRKIGDSCPTESYRNIDGLIGTIISSGKATLYELKTVYTLEDAMQLYECIAVENRNMDLRREYEQAKAKSKRGFRR